MDEKFLEQQTELLENIKESNISDIRKKKLVKGYPGECDYCGNYTERLVNDVCAPCRDKYKFP